MKYVAKVPLRVSFFGGGTDIPPYCNEFGGEILFCTINKYAYCEIESLPDSNAILLGESNEVYLDGDEEYTGKNGIIKAVLHEQKMQTGCRIKIYSDTEPGTGLGGSSAQIAAIILACCSLEHKEISKRELARQAYYIERMIMQVSGGYQDPITTVYGGIGYLKVNDIENFNVEFLKLDAGRAQELRKHLLLYNTGIRHDSSVIMEDHIKVQMKGRKQSKETLDFIKSLAVKARMMLEQGNIMDFGAMLYYGWEYKKRMSAQVSNDDINRLYDNVRKAGALGGKILGAGSGGYLLIFSDLKNQKRIRTFLLGEKGGIEEGWQFDFIGARVEKIK